MVYLIHVLLLIFVFKSCNGLPSQTNIDTKIIGGVDARKDYARHMVALINLTRPVCGGSIVSKCHVLTAAHCITPFVTNETLIDTFHGRVGSLKWAKGGTIIQFTKQYIHPQYNEIDIKYDVGLLVIKKRFEWSDSIGLIRLEYKWIDVEKSYVTGWGTTGPRISNNTVDLAPTPDDLQLLYVSTITAAQCTKDIQTAFENRPLTTKAPEIHPHVEICTFHSVGHGMCNGDSGSALVSKKRRRQIGIVSWGLPCAVGAPDVFTRISGVACFIKPILNKCK